MTKFEVIKEKFIETDGETLLLSSVDDFLDILGKCYGYNKLLIYQSNIDPIFFDLSSKLAGDILQKIVQYNIRTAFVVDLNTIKSKYFSQLVNESNSYSEYRFFENREKAEEWLLDERYD